MIRPRSIGVHLQQPKHNLTVMNEVSVVAEITTRQSSAMGVPPRGLLSRGAQSTSLPSRVAVAASPSAQYGNMYCGEGGLNVFTHAVHVFRITGVDHCGFKDDRDCNRFAQSRLLQFGTSPTCVQGTLFSPQHVLYPAHCVCNARVTPNTFRQSTSSSRCGHGRKQPSPTTKNQQLLSNPVTLRSRLTVLLTDLTLVKLRVCFLRRCSKSVGFSLVRLWMRLGTCQERCS